MAQQYKTSVQGLARRRENSMSSKWVCDESSLYLRVGDGQTVHRLGCLKQLDLFYDVGLRVQDDHSLKPALRWKTQDQTKSQLFHFCWLSATFLLNFSTTEMPHSALHLRVCTKIYIPIVPIFISGKVISTWIHHIDSSFKHSVVVTAHRLLQIFMVCKQITRPEQHLT